MLGLFAALLTGSRWSIVFGALIATGFAAFGAHVIWMLRRPSSKPPGSARPDFAVLHAAGSGVSLVVSIAIGLTLLVVPASDRTLHLAAAYGVVGLLGFLAQMVVAMEARLLPLATWFWAYERSRYQVPPPAPYSLRDRFLQTVVYCAWTIGVPSLAAGMYLESATLVALGAWSLFAGVVVGTLDNVFVIAPAFRALPPKTAPVKPSPRPAADPILLP